MRRDFKRLSRALLIGASTSALATFVSAGPSSAQDAAPAADSGGIETVVVTAEKRSENAQDVGMSISAFSGDQLENANITSMTDLAKLVPSLNIFQANNNRNTSIIIRNIGSSGTNPGIEPSVGVFLDGVYIPASGAVMNELLDVATVEVLRGPQGTLYGRNTPVGAVNITSRVPTDQFEAMIDLQYGNYDEKKASGYIGGGLTDDLAGRVSFWMDTRSGYEKNLYYGTSINDSDQYGGRTRLRWVPDELTTVDVIAYYSKIFSHGTVGAQLDPYGTGGIATPGFITASNAAAPGHPFVALGPFQVNEDDIPADATQSYGLSVQANRELPFNATVTNILAYNSFQDHLEELSADGLPQDVAHGNQNDLLSSASDELRIASTGKNWIDYVAGAYLFHEDLVYVNDILIDKGANRVFGTAGPLFVGDYSAFRYEQGTDSFAFFGQATGHITDSLRVVGGIRYSYDHKHVSIFNDDTNVITGVPSAPLTNTLFPETNQPHLSRTDTSTTWTGGLQYDVTEGVMAYFTAGSGFKDGGFNARASNVPPFDFGPEQSLTYELGLKSIFLDNHLLINADVYRMLLHGFQQSTLNPVTGSGFIVGNAGNVRVDGIEVDAQAHVFGPLTLNGNLSYSDTTYTDYPYGQCITTYPTNTPSSPPPAGAPQPNPDKAGTCIYTGHTPAYSPKWRWSIGGRWEQPWINPHYNWFVSANVSSVSSQFLDASLDPRSLEGGYTLLDANAGFEPESGTWRVSLWGRNLTDKVYFPVAAAQPLGALISSGGPFGANGFFGWYGPPRTFGLEGTYRF